MKRFLATLLAVVMVISVLPVGVWAEGNGSNTRAAHTHKVCNGSALCDGCSHTDVTYEAWSSPTSLPTSGNYYLTGNVEISAQTDLSGALNLCLNGHTVSVKSGVNCRHFWLKDGANLKITNCSTQDGILTGANGASIMNQYGKKATVELYNVVMKNNRYTGSTSGGGAIMMQGTTTVKLVGCKLLENKAAQGAVIRNHRPNSSVTLIGCEVKDNTADAISAIRLDDVCTLTLIDTVIEGNKTTKTGDESLGAIYATKAGATIVVAGKTKITGNTDGADKAANLFLQKNDDGSLPLLTVGEKGLDKDAKIAVCLENERLSSDGLTVSKALGTATAAASNFAVDNEGYIAKIEGGVVVAAKDSGHIHKLCSGDTACAACAHTDVTFLPWGEGEGEATKLPASGNYYLTKDVTLSAQRNVDGTTLNLCLNGFDIKTADGSSIRHFWVKNSGKLNICNCSDEEGVITGGKASAIMTENAGSCGVELYNIVFEGNCYTGGGGGAVMVQGSTTLKAVSCVFRNNTGSSSGGALRVYNQSNATLIGCEFKNNSAASMSAIRQDGGSLTLIDTVIENNTNTTKGQYNYGAVYAQNGSCTFTVKGQTRIVNNKNGDGNESNVWFQNTSGNQAVITVDGLSGNAMIGVTLQNSRMSATGGNVITKKLGGANPVAYFISDNAAYLPVIKDDAVILDNAEKYDHKHNICADNTCADHTSVTFNPWESSNSLPNSGNYYLTQDVELPSGAHIASELNLCLNGHTVTFKAGSKISFYMKNGASLSVTDCQTTGKITGGERNYGGVINVSQGSTFNLYGGTITGNKSLDMNNDKGKGGAVYLTKTDGTTPGGVFNMYGGTITGNEAYRGGAVYLCDGSAFNMYGGTIENNKATYRGGAITNDGVVSVNISGGRITGNEAKNGAAVYLCNGSAMTVSGGELTKNISTGVGGAILVESAGSKLTVTGGTFAENEGAEGGAIYASRNTVFEMSGGTIENNKATNGGGLYLNETKTTITGGTVKNNAATGEGGGIVFQNADVSLSGGEISGNTAALAGGIFLRSGTITLSGDPVVKDNKAGAKASNLYLPGAVVFTAKDLGNNASIGIGAERVSGAMSEKTAKDYSASFFSDDSALKVTHRDETVYLEPKVGHEHCLCNNLSQECKHESVSFAPWNNATKLPNSGSYYLTQDVELASGAHIASELNLCLNGHTITFKEGSKISFYMKNGASLSVTDCQTNGKITGGERNYGGVINVSLGSTFNLYGGTIIGNKSLDMDNDKGKGGAVYLTKTDGTTPGGVFNMYGGTITGNEAYRGGAVFLCDGSTFNLYGGTVSKNAATYRGGAIATEGASVINIIGGTITENTAANGASAYIKDGSVMTMTGGEITKNTATSAGSAMLIESKGTKFILKGGKIANNSTASDGTIYASRNTVFEMTGGEISGNKAKNGGGVYINESTADIKGGNIKNNTVTGSGAGVYFLKPVSGVISGGNITGNRCDSYGAGVYVYNGATATISGGNISYNTAVKGAGGGVCLMGGTLNLKGGTIGYNENLHKSNKGGGIMMYGGTLNMTGGHIVGNKVQSGVSGAGICCTGINQTKNGVKTTRPSKINMYGGTISDHVGNYGGAVILQSKTVMNMYNGKFLNNEAKGDGGAIYLNGGSVLNVYNGEFTGNKAGNRGGAVCYFTNTSGEITGGLFTGNYAGGYGGFLSAHGIGTKVTIKDLTITDNECAGYGGAVSITWNASLDMDNCEVYENKADKGGAMYLAHKTTCYLDDVKVYKNTSTGAGGAFYLDVGNSINFTNVKILDNASASSGGGIYTRANLHLKDCLISGNQADKNGGGIATGAAFTYGNLPEHTNGYVGRGQGMIIENTVIDSNTCTGSGGGAYMAKQNWNTIIDSTFTNNVAGELGSALFVGDDLMIKTGMTVTGNTSRTDGYAVYFNENSYDGQSHVLTMHEIGGNVIVKDNQGGDVMLCKDVALATTTEGYGKDTYFNITLSDGLLTDRVLGEYDYQGGDQFYTVTYGSRSYTEPEIDTSRTADKDTTGNGDIWLYAGLGSFVAVIAAVIIILLVKKKKTATPAEASQE